MSGVRNSIVVGFTVCVWYGLYVNVTQAAGISNLRVRLFDANVGEIFVPEDQFGDPTDGSFTLPVGFNTSPYTVEAIDHVLPIATGTGTSTSATLTLTNLKISLPSSNLSGETLRIVIEADWMHDAGTVSISGAAAGTVTTDGPTDQTIISMGVGFPPVLKEEESELFGNGSFDLDPVQDVINVPDGTETIEASLLITIPPGGMITLPDSFVVTFVIPEHTTFTLASLCLMGAACMRRNRL